MAVDPNIIALVAVQLARLWAEYEKITPGLTEEERKQLWNSTADRVKAADELWRNA